jgi:excisionase family DNA binding protein
MSVNRDHLRAADIAEVTGMSVRTIRRWIADEILPSTRLGGARLVARADLDRLLSPVQDLSSVIGESGYENGDNSR